MTTDNNVHQPCQNGNGVVRRCRPRANRLPQPEITVELGDQPVAISQVDLAGGYDFGTLATQCREHAGPVTFAVRDLLALSDADRYGLLTCTAECQGRCTITLMIDGVRRTFASLFDAALAHIYAGQPVELQGRARRAAIEAASLLHASELDIACSRIAELLRGAGVRGVLPQTLVRKAKQLMATTGTAETLSGEEAARKVIGVMSRSEDSALDEDGELDIDDDGPEDTSDRVRYYQDEYYQYDGTKWRKIPESEIKAQATQILQDLGYGQQITSRYISDVLTNIRGMTLLPSVDLPLPLWADEGQLPIKSPYISFSNGLVDLDELLAGSGELLCHDPRHFSTTVLPYDYDPDADCPLWRGTLRDIFTPTHDSDATRCDRRSEVLQEFFGYCLLSGDMRFEKFLVLYGEGANGKSTILRTLTALVGKDNLSNVPLDKIAGEFRLWQMHGKLANVANDMNRIEKVEEGLLKNLISGEPIQANRKHQPLVTMYPTAKLIFATNHLPPINDRSDGLFRRMIAMPFFRQFAGDQDHQRASRLEEELPGIFNWAIEGARRLLEQDGFTPCGVCSRALSDYRYQSDPIAQFVAECIERRASSSVATALVYDSYRGWCDGNGRRPVCSSEFGRQLTGHLRIQRVREGGGYRCYLYRGIALTPDAHLLASRVRRPRTS